MHYLIVSDRKGNADDNSLLEGRAMLIIAFGDVHMRTDKAERIPEIREADFVVVNGDLTVRGGRPEALAVVNALSGLNGKLYAHIGNMDEAEVDKMFTEMGMNLNGKGVVIGEVGLFGLGGSPPTPFDTPSEFSEQELQATLRKAYEEVKEARVKILFSHPPPVNTLLDRVRSGEHVGSSAVRSFLEETDCSACVCGHIHEAVGTDRVGSTLVINPGMLAQGGYARIEWDGEKLTATLEQC
jgi:Icc-related predicted phosphoesterase